MSRTMTQDAIFFDRNRNSPMGDTIVNEHFWSTYSLIPQPASMSARRRNWPLYVSLLLIGAALAYLIVHGVTV